MVRVRKPLYYTFRGSEVVGLVSEGSPIYPPFARI